MELVFVPSLVRLCLNHWLEVLFGQFFSFGVYCVFYFHSFVIYFAEALSRLNNVIRQPDALLPDNVMAYDNAVSALGKVCVFHRECIDAAQV